MQLIYAIKKRIRVNWEYTILYHMKHQQRFSGGLPYARLITKIMRFYEVDLKIEPKNKMKKQCEINVGAALKNTGIFQDIDGIFKYKDDNTAPIPPPETEGGYTNEAIYNKL